MGDQITVKTRVPAESSKRSGILRKVLIVIVAIAVIGGTLKLLFNGFDVMDVVVLGVAVAAGISLIRQNSAVECKASFAFDSEALQIYYFDYTEAFMHSYTIEYEDIRYIKYDDDTSILRIVGDYVLENKNGSTRSMTGQWTVLVNNNDALQIEKMFDTYAPNAVKI